MKGGETMKFSEMEVYRQINLKQAIDLIDEDVSCLFYRDKSCKSLHSFEQYGDELSFHDARCSTWFMREKNPTNRTTISG